VGDMPNFQNLAYLSFPKNWDYFS